MRPVVILGDGQLGAMLKQAGDRLGMSVLPVSPEAAEAESMALPDDALITAEREHWPDNPLTRRLCEHVGWQNRTAFTHLSDRILQKQLLDALAVPTAPWLPVNGQSSVPSLHAALGEDLFIKSARGGYDGNGQLRLQRGHNVPRLLPEWMGRAVAESAVHYATEVSLIAARNRSGDMVFYELTENFHDAGILRVSLQTPGRFRAWQRSAEQMVARVMEHLDYRGVMAVEFFVTDQGLLVNEIAPRVHNSGHWTQAGASISQFEMHLRAICDWPLPEAVQHGYSLMVNLIGTDRDPLWLQMPGAQMHWYNKALRPGRKLGHVNFTHAEPSVLLAWIESMPLSGVEGPAWQEALFFLRACSCARLQGTEQSLAV